MSMIDAKILVATHKKYEFPSDEIYTPIQVGVARGGIDFGYLRDDVGENISIKNDSFCELTALYWAWKSGYSKRSQYIGLVHYRRYFSGKSKFGSVDILGSEEIDELMNSYDVVLPKKRNYYIQSIESHYRDAHYGEDLDKLREAIERLSPEYINMYDSVMSRRSLYLYNMFIISSEKFSSYCEWLFSVLNELEKTIDISQRDTYQKRVFGFLGERLLNVWILQNHLKIIEIGVVNLEGENLAKKGWDMLGRMISLKKRDS